MTILTAQRRTINVGVIPLEVFRLPDGQYRLSQTQVLESVGVPSNWISRLQSSTPKQLKALRDKGFRGYSQDLKVFDESKARKIKGIPIDEATKIWGLLARSGNNLAIDLLEACASEAIERRADVAYEVQRTEEEINEQLKVRMQGKATRRSLNDAIASYLDRNEASENRRKFTYSNVSDCTNRKIFGKSSKQLAEERGVKSDRLRDTHNEESLRRIERLETFAARLIDKQNTEPLTAVKEAIAFYED